MGNAWWAELLLHNLEVSGMLSEFFFFFCNSYHIENLTKVKLKGETISQAFILYFSWLSYRSVSIPQQTGSENSAMVGQ